MPTSSGIGQSIPRVEDDRFVRGEGRYTADIHLSQETHMVVLRSPHASARILSIDKTAALASPGVLLVLTAADLDALKIHIGSKVPLPATVALNVIIKDADGVNRFWALAFQPGAPEFHAEACRALGLAASA